MMIVQRTRVFAIGFNKCGTSSINEIFKQSGYRAVHWNLDPDRFVANVIFSNFCLGRNLLQGIDNFDCYSDMNFITNDVYLEANALYKEFDSQYPGSLFILNTRDRKNWIRSRLSHGSGTFLARSKIFFQATEQNVVKIWEKSWDDHHHEVRKYFSGASNFIEFNIENDNIDRLGEFLESHDIRLHREKWGKFNAT